MSDPKSDRRERWDAIVVGSGLGGLSTAAYLCALGKRTLVLESHYVAGGNSQVFRRRHHGRAYEFDVGIHYIGECGHDGVITKVLNGVGLAERVVFRPLDPDAYSTLVFPDLTFRVPTGWDRYRERLFETFPAEREPLGRLLDVMRDVANDAQRLARHEFGMAELATRAPAFVRWGLRPVTQVFDEFAISQRAQAVLLGEQGCYAVRPSKTPLVVASGVTDHFLRGAYYPEGGGQVIAARLIEAIRAYGGEVRTRAPVRRIRVENGRAAGVTVARRGRRDVEIDAPIVVSNADLKRTVFELVGEAHFSPATRERIRSLRMAIPLFGVYLGLDVDMAKLGHGNGNYFVWGTYDIERVYEELEGGRLTSDAMAYITMASLKDPVSGHIAPEGHTNLQIMTLVPREYAVWGVDRGPADGARYHRDREYRRRKNEMMERLIAIAEQVLPGLSEHIDWKEAATPVSQERFTRSTGGTSYGIEMSTDQAGPLRVGPRTEIEGLFLCGASTPSGPGIAGVLRGGVLAAGEILDTDLLRPILAGEVFGDRSALPPLEAGWDAWRLCASLA
jgi:phytoene dehydrogenase-like protein